MYQRILLAYDGSASGQGALLEGCELALWMHAELHLIAVRPRAMAVLALEAHQFQTTLPEGEMAHYQSILDAGVAHMERSGLRVHASLMTGDPVKEISSYAQKIAAQLIVLGHRHRDPRSIRWWRSSTSKELLEIVPCSVLVVIAQQPEGGVEDP